jgi:hypothetical protein
MALLILPVMDAKCRKTQHLKLHETPALTVSLHCFPLVLAPLPIRRDLNKTFSSFAGQAVW